MDWCAMSRKPIHPATLAATLAMIGTGKNWPTKTRIVLAIGAYEGGAWMTAGDVADITGISTARVRKLLAELTDARVLLRDGGGGGRVFWTEVNPDPTMWRWVPWVHDRRGLAMRLNDHLANARRGALRRFIARPMWERCRDAQRALLVERSGSVKGSSSRANRARDDEASGAVGETSSRAQDVRSDPLASAESAAEEAMPRSPLPKKLLLGKSGDEEVVVGDGDEPTTTPIVITQVEGLPAAKAVLIARALPGREGRKYLAPAKEAQLAELVRAHGRDAVCDTLRSIAVDQVPGMLDATAAALHTEPLDPAEQARRTEERADTIRQLLLVDELDDDYRASLMDELAGCENGGAAASGGTGL